MIKDHTTRRSWWDRRRRLVQAVVAACVVLLLILNFDARFGDSPDRVGIKKTPDQMYDPTYPDTPSSFGVIFAANGPFLERAFQSALALGKDANATIFTDDRGARQCERLKKRRPFIRGLHCRAVHEVPTSWGFRSVKLFAFTATPYDKTLYLDADAYPCADFHWLRKELSPAIERYDIMATHSSFRKGMPHALHWLNAGVIAFDNRSSRATAVFHQWLRSYEEKLSASSEILTDQRLFNEAVLASRARSFVLPPEFNCKSNYKSVRYEWAKTLSPAFYRSVRKNARCCTVPSVGTCVIDHECRFPDLRRRY